MREEGGRACTAGVASQSRAVLKGPAFAERGPPTKGLPQSAGEQESQAERKGEGQDGVGPVGGLTDGDSAGE